MRIIAISLSLLLLAGCASKTTQPIHKSSYQIGQEQVAVLGVPFLTEERGSIEHSQQWQGIAFGGMHHSYTKSTDYRMTELFYGGLESGRAIIVVQTLRGNESAPTRKQHSIDLNGYGPYQVGPYTLDILSASAANMRFRVLGRN